MLLEKHWVSAKTVPIAIPLMFLILLSKKDLHFSFFFSFFFEVCLRQIRGYFYGAFYESFSCTLVFSALSWGFISPWLYKLSRIYRNSFQVNCLSLNSCLILKKMKTSSYLSKEKNISSYLILTYHGNQTSRKREQFLFLHNTQ